jgi:hypothetical protein
MPVNLLLQHTRLVRLPFPSRPDTVDAKKLDELKFRNIRFHTRKTTRRGIHAAAIGDAGWVRVGSDEQNWARPIHGRPTNVDTFPPSAAAVWILLRARKGGIDMVSSMKHE